MWFDARWKFGNVGEKDDWLLITCNKEGRVFLEHALPTHCSLSSCCTRSHKHLDKQEALPAYLKHPEGSCEGMVAGLQRVNLSFSEFHSVLNPVKIAIHICINTRYVFAATAYSPADDSNQIHTIILHTHQRPSRVTLQRSSRLITISLFGFALSFPPRLALEMHCLQEHPM